MVTWLRYRGVVSQGLGRWRLASRVFRCVEMYPPGWTSCMEEVVVGLCATLDDVGTDRVSTESGCGSAGSLSAGLLLRRGVVCAEEFAGNSGDAGRLRLETWVGWYVVT